jgi:hypothetical protein
MLERVDEAPESGFSTLNEIEKKLKVAKAYNKQVKEKSFQVGDIVWKTILPLGTRNDSSGSGRLAGRGHIGLSR